MSLATPVLKGFVVELRNGADAVFAYTRHCPPVDAAEHTEEAFTWQAIADSMAVQANGRKKDMSCEG